MDEEPRFGCFGKLSVRLFCLFSAPLMRSAMSLSAAFCLCVPLFGSGSSGLGHASETRTPSDTCVFRGKGRVLH